MYVNDPNTYSPPQEDSPVRNLHTISVLDSSDYELQDISYFKPIFQPLQNNFGGDSSSNKSKVDENNMALKTTAGHVSPVEEFRVRDCLLSERLTQYFVNPLVMAANRQSSPISSNFMIMDESLSGGCCFDAGDLSSASPGDVLFRSVLGDITSPATPTDLTVDP